MKIDELIEVLKRRREKYGDVEVEVTYEGITRDITPANVYALKGSKVLLIDADDNFYKKFNNGGLAEAPDEGEDGL